MEERRYTYIRTHTHTHAILLKVFTHSSKSLNSGVTIVSMAAGVKKIKHLGMQAASTNIFNRMGHFTEWYHNRMSPM